MKNNIIRAMLDYNIIFKSKYFDEVNVEHFIYYQVIAKYVRDKVDAMNGYEHMRYKLFRKVKGLKFGSEFSGVPRTRQVFVTRDLYPKRTHRWGEIGDLYFKLETP
jgi:hypothetical protein